MIPNKDIHARASENVLPGPRGNRVVGFCKFVLTDATRKDFFRKSMNRKFEVLVWYPGASASEGGPKSYLSDHEIRRLRHLQLRFGVTKANAIISKIKTNSFNEIPMSGDRNKFPVLLFSHDMAMLPEYYTILMEHLAAEGYVVFSINHANLSESCLLEFSEHNKVVKTRFRKRDAIKNALLLLRTRKLLADKTQSQRWAMSKEIIKQWHSLDELHAEMAKDRRFLMTFLSQPSGDFFIKNLPYSLFTNRLDMSQLGVIGHGWGGASAVDSLIVDDRVKAAINLNGFQFTRAMNETIRKPLLMLYSQQWSGINEGIYFWTSEFDSYTIPDSKNDLFSDWGFLCQPNEQSENSFYECLTLIINFFDRHLRCINHAQGLKVTNL